MVDMVKGKSQGVFVNPSEQLDNRKVVNGDDNLLKLTAQLEALKQDMASVSEGSLSGKGGAFQIEPGASGVLMKSFSEVLALIQQILRLEAAQKGSAAEVQGTTAQAAAASMKESGTYQMAQALLQGGISIAGSAISAGMGSMMGRKEANAAMAENKVLSGKLAEVSEIASYKPQAGLSGATTDTGQAGVVGTRVESIRKGDIADSLSPENIQQTKEALKNMNSPTDVQSRVSLQKHASRQASELTRRKSEITQDIANKAGQRNAAVNAVQTGASSLGGAAAGGFSVGKADEDANAELNRAATSQANAVAQGIDAEAQKATQQIQSVVQAQERAAQSESVR